MDIYHTKKQAENTPRSCSYQLLKTLFYFISQCTSEPYLESGLCKLDKELDNCNFSFIYPRNRPFNESCYEVCRLNIKLCDILGCFHYILNAPRMLPNILLNISYLYKKNLIRLLVYKRPGM